MTTTPRLGRPLLAALAGAALLLGGCVMHIENTAARAEAPAMQARAVALPLQALDKRNPRVQVAGGRVTVDQEVLYFGSGERDVRITWTLPPKGRLRFAENGIQFGKSADGEIVDCKRSADGLQFSCLNRHTRRDFHKYDIRVNDGDHPLPPLDPYVVND